MKKTFAISSYSDSFSLLHLLECCFKFILKIKDTELNGVNPSSHLCKPRSTAMTPQVSINLTSVNTFAMFWLTPVVNINPPYVLFKIDKCSDKQDHTNRNVPIPRQRATITQPIETLPWRDLSQAKEAEVANNNSWLKGQKQLMAEQPPSFQYIYKHLRFTAGNEGTGQLQLFIACRGSSWSGPWGTLPMVLLSWASPLSAKMLFQQWIFLPVMLKWNWIKSKTSFPRGHPHSNFSQYTQPSASRGTLENDCQ